jgi:hypothetical protein
MMSDTPRTDKQIAFIKDQIKNDSASLCADHPYYVLDVMAALCCELEAEVVRKDAALLESQQMMLDEQEKRLDTEAKLQAIYAEANSPNASLSYIAKLSNGSPAEGAES